MKRKLDNLPSQTFPKIFTFHCLYYIEKITFELNTYPLLSDKRTVDHVHPDHSDDHSIFHPPPPSFQQSSRYHLYSQLGHVSVFTPSLLGFAGIQVSKSHGVPSVQWRGQSRQSLFPPIHSLGPVDRPATKSFSSAEWMDTSSAWQKDHHLHHRYETKIVSPCYFCNNHAPLPKFSSQGNTCNISL